MSVVLAISQANIGQVVCEGWAGVTCVWMREFGLG